MAATTVARSAELVAGRLSALGRRNMKRNSKSAAQGERAAALLILAAFTGGDTLRQAIAEVGDQLAAVFVEPLVGSAGGIPADRSFLDQLRGLANERQTLLIFHEVQTVGLAYCGPHEVYGANANLTAVVRFHGGELSFGVIGGPADVVDGLASVRADGIARDGLFDNNPMKNAGRTGLVERACPAALSAVNADRLRTAFEESARTGSIPIRVGGVWPILTLRFQREPLAHPGAARTPPAWRNLVHFEVLLRGLYLPQYRTLTLSLATSRADCIHLARTFAAIPDAQADCAQDELALCDAASVF